jgi:hypothetical protein
MDADRACADFAHCQSTRGEPAQCGRRTTNVSTTKTPPVALVLTINPRQPGGITKKKVGRAENRELAERELPFSVN